MEGKGEGKRSKEQPRQVGVERDSVIDGSRARSIGNTS